jgi:hypothetical protein
VLKRLWILPGLTFLAALLALIGPLLLVDASGKRDPAWTPFLVVVGALGALAVIVDRIADAYDAREASQKLDSTAQIAQFAVVDLNTFLLGVHGIPTAEGNARTALLSELRRQVTASAAKSIGVGSRATYYTLTYDDNGMRTLGDPVHAAEYGRNDKPDRPFVESEDPTHPIWRLMNGPDEEQEVQVASVDYPGLDWTRKRYDTFVSFPVKCKDKAFGMLSVNNSVEGAIGAAQREVILAMARSMAAVLAMDSGPRVMNRPPVVPQMSGAGSSVSTTDQGGV